MAKKNGTEAASEPVSLTTEDAIALEVFVQRARGLSPCGQSEASQLKTEAAFARRAAAAFVASGKPEAAPAS